MPAFLVESRSYRQLLLGLVLLILLSDEQLSMRCFAVSSTSTTLNATMEVTSATTTTNNTATASTTEASYRLPVRVGPQHYDLEIQTYINDSDPENFKFKGRVRILVRCYVATDNITLHVHELTVDNISISVDPKTPSASEDPTYISHDRDLERQFLIIRLNKRMEDSKQYWIEMNFNSSIKNKMTGLYYSSSVRGNHTVYTATTRLFPIHARKMFPCFDEPAIKATFNVTVVRPANKLSISNMQIINSSTTFEEDGTTYVKDVYSQTPQMTTCTLGFVVCDFDYLEIISKDNITFRVWANPEIINATRYALEVVVKSTEFYEQYFEIKYTLPKQDLVVIPDLPRNIGAMEQWGLISFNEMYALYTPGVTRGYMREILVRIAAHEAVHGWVGDLMTHAWWSEMWLNEAFASYFELLAMDAVHPEWKQFEYFIVSKLQPGFDSDAQITSVPIYKQAEKPAEIEQLTDAILYTKGPCIVRMLSFVLGDSTFRKGYVNLLKKRLYSTIYRDDIYREMKEQARSDGLDINVKEFIDTWVLQRNFPVVTVAQNMYNNTVLHVTQERFLEDPSAKHHDTSRSPFRYRWTIPLTVASSNYSIFNQTGSDVYWLNKEEHAKTLHVNIPLPNCADPNGWVLVNLHQYGYYRVNYQASNWLALSRQLKRNHSVIPVNNRVQIINDAWSLVKAGYISMNIALATLEYLHHELKYTPWVAAWKEIHMTIGFKLESTQLGEPFRNFMRERLTAPFQHFGLVNITDDHMDKFTQHLLIKTACGFHVQACLDQARIVYNAYMASDGQQHIDPELKQTILCAGVAGGGKLEWDNALEMFNRTENSKVEQEMISAMACSLDTQILRSFLDSTLGENATFAGKNSMTVVSEVMVSDTGRALAWEFFKNNYEELRTRDTSFKCKDLASSTFKFNREVDLAEVNTFWTQHCHNESRTDFESKVVKPIKDKISWLQKYSPSIRKWMIKNGLIGR